MYWQPTFLISTVQSFSVNPFKDHKCNLMLLFFKIKAVSEFHLQTQSDVVNDKNNLRLKQGLSYRAKY